MFVKTKKIEAHAAPGGARRTLSAHALPNCTKPAPFSRRAIPPQRPTNASNKNNAGLIVYFASLQGGRRACSPDVRPRPAAWRRGCEERRARSAGVRSPRWATHTIHMVECGTWSFAHPSRSVAGRRCRGHRRAPPCGLVSQIARAATVGQRTGARYMNQEGPL